MTDLNIVLTVQERRTEAAGYVSIRFDLPAGVTYEPGDWLDIRFPTAEFPVGRTYSFASSPTERGVLIAFRIGRSAFKAALAAVEPGDTMLITQYGSNGFRHDSRSAAVFLAGGIGITPFRSMIKRALDSGLEADIQLLYFNHDHDFPFWGELEAWQRAAPNFRVHFVVTGDEGRLTASKLRKLVPDITTRNCYVAGSPAMVDALKGMIESAGVGADAILTDSFDGY